MININSFMIGSSQVKVLAEFYEKIFGKEADMHEGEWYGWSAGSCFFSLGAHSEVKGKAKEPQRMIFNIETKAVKEEFERIKKTGAEVVKEPYDMGNDMWVATFADPDGNYFQLMSPWENSN